MTIRKCLIEMWAVFLLHPHFEGLRNNGCTDHDALKQTLYFIDSIGKLARCWLWFSDFDVTQRAGINTEQRMLHSDQRLVKSIKTPMAVEIPVLRIMASIPPIWKSEGYVLWRSTTCWTKKELGSLQHSQWQHRFGTRHNKCPMIAQEFIQYFCRRLIMTGMEFWFVQHTSSRQYKTCSYVSTTTYFISFALSKIKRSPRWKTEVPPRYDVNIIDHTLQTTVLQVWKHVARDLILDRRDATTLPTRIPCT